ncbi:hypothetical protein EG830_11175 [bacterium]|nr:hypothetical protein [bacterium]
MTLDNGKRIVLIRLIGFITTLVYVLYVFLAYFPKVFRHVMTENSLTIMTVAVTAVYLIVLLRPTILKYMYLFFSADEKRITLRWYKPGLMPGESRSIEIPADRFAGYEVKVKYFGLHRYIILFQQVQGRRAAYPPVSISALSGKQRAEIEETLRNYKSAI